MALMLGTAGLGIGEPSQALVEKLNRQVDELRDRYKPRDTCSRLWSESSQPSQPDGPLLPALVRKDLLQDVFAPLEKHALANGLYSGGRLRRDLRERLDYVNKERDSLSAIVAQASPVEASIFSQSLADLTYEAQFLERLVAPPDISSEIAAHVRAVEALANHVSRKISELPATSQTAERLQSFEKRGLRKLKRDCGLTRPAFVSTSQWQALLDNHAPGWPEGSDGFAAVEAAVVARYTAVLSDRQAPFTAQFLEFETAADGEKVKSRFSGLLVNAAEASGLIDAIDKRIRSLEAIDRVRQVVAEKIAEDTQRLAEIQYSLAKLSAKDDWGVPQSAGFDDYQLVHTEESARYSAQTKLSCIGVRSKPTVQAELLVVGKQDLDARWSTGNARSHQVAISYSEGGKTFRRRVSASVKRVGYTNYQNSILLSVFSMPAEAESFVEFNQKIVTAALGGELSSVAVNDRAKSAPLIEGTGRLQVTGKFWIGGHQVAWRSPNILAKAATIYGACAEIEAADK